MRGPALLALGLASLGLHLAPSALARGGTASRQRLVVRTSRIWGYSMLLPASWRVRNASYPSDHATIRWSDPADGAETVQIVFSGCYGCSHTLTTGAPRPTVGGNLRVSSTYVISPTRLAYAAVSPGDAYPDNGLVIVTTQGFTQIDCWLPQSEHHIATLILNSYHAMSLAARSTGDRRDSAVVAAGHSMWRDRAAIESRRVASDSAVEGPRPGRGDDHRLWRRGRMRSGTSNHPSEPRQGMGRRSGRGSARIQCDIPGTAHDDG